MSATSMMRNTCTITPVTESQTSTTGELTETDGTPVTLVTCSIQQNGGSEFLQQGRLDGQRSFSCYFPAGTTIATNSRISTIVGASGIASDVVLKVTSPPQDHAGRSAYLMVTAEEINE